MATKGAVLEGARASQTNSAQSELPSCGVARDFKQVASDLSALSPAIVDLHGSQYAASFLEDAQAQQTEYAIWAANSSQVALVPITTTNANTKGVAQGTGSVPQGSLTVGSYTDGANYLLAFDTQGRAVGNVLSILYRVGASSYYLLVGTGVTPPTVNLEDQDGDPIAVTTVPNAFGTMDADAGFVGLSAGALTALGGGVSQARGDAVLTSYLVLANQTFWWSKNDPQTTRFTYDNKTQKWAPIKGSSVQDVAVVTGDFPVVSLSPAPREFSIGDFLPADATDSDKYAMLRVGSQPSAAASTPVAYVAVPAPNQFSGVRVVADEDVNSFAFSGGDAVLAGVCGVSSGKLKANPAWAAANVGLHLWYSAYTFDETANGEVAPLLGSNATPRFIAPIPSPTEVAFIRIGSRRYLTAVMVKNDAELLATVPTDSQVVVSLSTGRLRFSPNVPNWADPNSPSFKPSYLGEAIYYDGVACCAKPQPLRQPAQAVNSAGAVVADVSALDDLYLPIANPFDNNGLGSSGVFYLPDDTGSTPQAGTPPVRAGGDNLTDTNIGLVRRIGPRIGAYALGDDVAFWYGGAIPTTKAVGYTDDLPTFSWSVDADEVLVTEQAAAGTRSRILLNGDKQGSIEGPLYYQNTLLTPAFYTNKARLVSRIRNSFTVSGTQTEKLYFRINNDRFLWTASLLTPLTLTTYTAEQMAASLLLSPRTNGAGTLGSNYPNAVRVDRGHLILEATTYVGIGFGTPTLDLSGCRVTGFLAGWQATDGQDNWCNDSGLSFGFGRSPLNLARSSSTPDYIDRARTVNQVLTRAAGAIPYQRFDYNPLRDVAGYGEDVFFRRVAVVKGNPVTTDLRQYEDIVYDFAYTRFGWLQENTVEATVLQPIAEMPLGSTNIIPQTMLGVEPNPTGGIALAEGNGPFQTLTQDVDYLLPNDGASGSAILTENIGQEVTNGYRGQWASGSSTFSDATADFVAAGAAAGYLLRLYPTGMASKTYTVTGVVDANTLAITPAFDTTSTNGTWTLFDGNTSAAYDRAVLADFVYESFNPLPNQTIAVHLLSPLGKTPVDAAAQSANRLTANLADALANGRALNLRFDATGTNTASLTQIGQAKLGTVANNNLFVLDVGTTRVTTQSFSILVGNQLFTHGGANPLVPVGAFSPNPVGVEYLTTTGELKFNSSVLSDFAGSLVYQVDEFLPAASLAAGQSEYKVDGMLNLSAADLATNQNATVFLEEALNMGVDMAVNPMAGSFYLAKPLRPYQRVWVSYWQAGPSSEMAVDARGNPIAITEFLPFYAQLEVAARVSPTLYSFDLPDANGVVRTLKDSVTPTVYVGATLQNYGQEPTATFDYAQRTVTLAESVPTTTEVKVSYAVVEAFGGERAFTVTTTPIFQPPFFLPAGTSQFQLAGDRRDLIAGMMMRLGAATFYIKSVAYEADLAASPSINAPYLGYPNVLGITTVEIYPPTTTEVGARSPSQQALTLITARPVTDQVGTVQTNGPAGLWLDITNQFDPVNRGNTSITFQGQVQYSTPAPVALMAGMILELDGQPYTIAKSELSEDGTQQIVSVTAPFPYFFTYASGVGVRVSARPVYPLGAKEFLPVGPMVAAKPVELVRFAEGQAGVLLTPDLDWAYNTAEGSVRLLGNALGLQAGERLLLRWTVQRVLSASINNGVLQIPRYTATYRYLTTPSEDNGLLGSTVQATYSFRYPDSFYCRELPLLGYLAEFAQGIINQTQQTTGQSQGALLTSMATSLSNNGQQSLLSQRQTLVNADRAARSYLSFYNDTIVAFEQVLEAMDGQIVGDRDGKFRFYTSDAAFLPAPGLTDPFTGSLITRNIFSEVWNGLAGDYLPLRTSDRLVFPTGYTLTDGKLEGDLPSSAWLKQTLLQQRSLIRNDIDDLILVGSKGARFDLVFSPYVLGSYERLGEPNVYSRLFPEQAQGLCITLPGLDADIANGVRGEYAFANLDKLFSEGVRSTFLTQIGQVTSPVLGPLTNLNSISMQVRTPRGWIFGYYPNGIAANALYAGQPAINEPCAIVTVIPISEVPINPNTGFPDATKFSALLAGGLPDLTTGATDTLLPYWISPTMGKFYPTMQLEGGTPDGKSVALSSQATFSDGELGGLYVYDVKYGCVVRFANVNGTLLNNPSQLLALGNGAYAPEQGDTLRVRIRPDDSDTSLYQTLAHKDNWDTYVNFKTGAIEDLTAPFIPNQDPLFPLEFVQAQVSFTNTSIEPTLFPALSGQPLLDNGDYSFPFLGVANTEMERFDQITNAMASVMTARGPMPNQYFVYPDEILFADGNTRIAASATLPPSTLLTDTDFTPPVTYGTGSVNAFDLLLVQTTTGTPTLPASAFGFQTVASYTQPDATTRADVPRFPSQTKKGAEIEYTLENYMAFVTSTGKLLLVEDQTGAAPNGQVNKWVTLLDFSAMAAVNGGVLDSGWNMGAGVAGVGGLNTFLAANPSNEVRIRVYTLTNEVQGVTPYDKGDIVEEFVITQGSVEALVANSGVVLGTPQFGWNDNHRLIRFIPTANGAGGSVIGLSALPVVNRFGTINTPAAGLWETDSLFYFSISLRGYSSSAFIDADRLTFKEVLDLRHAQDRGTVQADGGWDVQTKLLVDRVRARDSANVPQWLSYKYLNGKVSNAPLGIGCPFTFLPRVAGSPIGTFTAATGPASNDEVGSIKAMSWEGVKPIGSGAVLIPNLVGTRVDSVTVFDGGAGYNGGYVELVFDPPPAGGRTATAAATVVGGAITNVTVKLKGFGYVAAPNITVRHYAGNQSVGATTAIIASAVPSSPDNTAGTICTGTALLGYEAGVGLRPVLRESNLLSGNLSNIETGDIVAVTQDTTDPTHEATAMAGTYLVRHTVVPVAPADPQKDLDLTTTVGSGAGWATVPTPQVKNWDATALTLTLTTLGNFGGIEIIDGTEGVPQTTLTTAVPHGYKAGDLITIGGAVTIPPILGTHEVLATPAEDKLTINVAIVPSGFAYGGRILEAAEPMPPHLWLGLEDYGAFPHPTTWNIAYGPNWPRVYIVTKQAGVNTEAISMEYDTGVGANPYANTLKLRAGSARDKNGAGITDSAFFAALQSGQKVSGMVYFPIVLSDTVGVQNNVMAYLSGTVNGFRHLRIQNTSTANIADFPLGLLNAVNPYSGYMPSPVGTVGIGVCIPRDSDRFILRRELAVYPNAPALLDLMGVANNQGAILTGAGRPHAFAGVSCLVTGDQLVTSDVGGGNTLQVVAGVYLEPSFPVSANPVVGGPWVGQIFSVSNTNPAVVTFDPTQQVGPLRRGDTITICNTIDTTLNATWTVLSYTAGTVSFTIAYDRSVLPILGAGGDVYGVDQPHMVDKNTNPVLLQTVGVRDVGFQQRLSYSVRRIRRFHEANNRVSANFLPLRYAYETRRGIITAVATSSKQVTTVTAAGYVFPTTDPDYFNGKVYTGTQLGGFDSPDVNIKVGDLFRIIDPTLPPSQRVVETRTIKSVSGSGALVLDTPALQTTITPNVTQFEVWLRNAVIPHQQSCDQLLEAITEETVVDRIVNRTNPADPSYRKGGFVQVTYGPTRIASYDTHVNKMQDDYMTGVLAKTFRDFGVQLGDIVLVDPQGAVGNHGAGVPNLEFGTRPYGDISIAERGAPAYTAGKPSFVDDNRGFYRVTKIDAGTNTLTVDGTTAFGSGSKASTVTFPSANANKATYGYAVYPTVHDSVNVAPLAGGANPEGQVALRPTSLPGLKTDGTPASTPDTYLETEYSVRPFAYRIIRPTTLLSREAIDLILTMRERMLSLIEQFKVAISGNLGGDYYTFQKNMYGRDLGYPTLPSTGTGVFRNIVIDTLLGRLNTVPFTNDADCVSVLDRRFWILDTRLDSLTTDGTGYGTKLVTPPEVPYTGYNATGASSTVRPVLPDRIGIVLDYRDRLRDLRFSWITYRVNRLSGSLPAIARFDAQYANARSQQLAAMRQRRSLTGG